MEKYVYFFGNGKAEGKASMKPELGGKGANLAEMTNIGVPVPPGFTISASVCDYYGKNSNNKPDGLEEQVNENIKKLEDSLNMRFGDKESPLLVSVRSGAAISMPGMMDTVLNLGMNDTTVEVIAKKSNNPRFAWDSYRRFLQMFGDVVMEISHKKFEKELQTVKDIKGVSNDLDLNTEDLKEVVKKYKELYKKEGKPFPEDPKDQLWYGINAVFGSWNNPRAIRYREINDMPKDLLGTAVNVQAMVFGNMGETSGTGVAFTRNPSTGEKKFYGEFLMNAQGEDVVAGIRTPQPISELKDTMSNAYNELCDIYKKLENHYKDMQDLEFTIQDKKLFLLQTRTGKRTAGAAVRIAVEMVEEGLIDKETALMRIEPNALDQLLHPTFDQEDLKRSEVLGKGLPASPGAASGKIYFTAEDAVEASKRGESVILVRTETSPEDIDGMHIANGILTARGGMTSHAAVVARGWGKCCVAGCKALNINENTKTCVIGENSYFEGDIISIDGSTGNVYNGKIATKEAELSGNFAKIMQWADDIKKLGVRTNADTPNDAAVAIKFGAKGIGLCRTEHMFFGDERIAAMREMIMAKTVEGRVAALDKLKPYQKADFKGIFEEMKEYPVTVRLVDPPLHEFLPNRNEVFEQIVNLKISLTKASDLDEINNILSKISKLEKQMDVVESLHELNPMMGHRGLRLSVTYPEIIKMQVSAIIEAAVEVKKEKGYNIVPEIMIPLTCHYKEFNYVKKYAVEQAEEIITRSGIELKYMIGTMIEIPRATLVADKIAEDAEFFSFGTNDLTQMTFGFSRDDAGKFLGEYKEKGILDYDVFQRIDEEGVGQLVKTACERGRSTRPNIKLGICGEHGGEPNSVDFCHRVGLNYVSCSPYRVPIARLSAAQAQIREKKNVNSFKTRSLGVRKTKTAEA